MRRPRRKHFPDVPLRRKRLELGYDKSLIAGLIGMRRDRYSEIERMDVSPLYIKRSWKPWARSLAELLECSPDELFPDYTRRFKTPPDQEAVEPIQLYVSEHSQNMSIPIDEFLDGEFTKKHRPEIVRFAFCGVTPREKIALILRYGLFEKKYNKRSKKHTLEKIGKILKLTRERVRQVLERALRKIRLKSSGFLRSFQLDEM